MKIWLEGYAQTGGTFFFEGYDGVLYPFFPGNHGKGGHIEAGHIEHGNSMNSHTERLKLR